MTQASGPNQTASDLLKLLVEQKIISAAQADVALADEQVSGMTIDEVLIARRWVSEEVLHQVAPWLKEQRRSAAKLVPPAKSAGVYQENLKKYRDLMSEILGE